MKGDYNAYAHDFWPVKKIWSGIPIFNAPENLVNGTNITNLLREFVHSKRQVKLTGHFLYGSTSGRRGTDENPESSSFIVQEVEAFENLDYFRNESSFSHSRRDETSLKVVYEIISIHFIIRKLLTDD